MRLRVRHEIIARFDEPATMVTRSLRLTPRTFDGQYVRRWRIDVDSDCRQERTVDPFGNIVHDFTILGPLPGIAIISDGEVEVDDTAGVLRGMGVDRMPSGVFLRATDLTDCTPAIGDLIAAARKDSDGSALDLCHRLMDQLHDQLEVTPLEIEELTGVSIRKAADALTSGEGSAVDLAHLFIAAMRRSGLPSRFVSGYLMTEEGTGRPHAWAETLIGGLGWVGFDVPNNRCPTDRYVRLATGIDQGGAAFLRGYDRGGSPASLTVKCSVEQIPF